MRKYIYFFIISILFCGFSHSSDMEVLSVHSKKKIVEDQAGSLCYSVDSFESVRKQAGFLCNGVELFFRDMFCFCDSLINIKGCNFKDVFLCSHRNLSVNIYNYLLVKNPEQNVNIICLYYGKDDDVEIAKKILIKEFELVRDVVLNTQDKKYILEENLQKALEDFTEEIYKILEKVGAYNQAKQKINKRIKQILGIASANGPEEKPKEEEEEMQETWQEISEIAITEEIKKEIRERTNKRIKKIESFEKEHYKDAELHREELLNHSQNSFQDKNSPTKNIKTKKQSSNKKWPLYAGILGGVIVATGVGFGIYYGIKKKPEETEDTIAL